MAAKQLTDEMLQQTAEMFRKHGSTEAARLLGISRNTFDARVTAAVRRGFVSRSERDTFARPLVSYPELPAEDGEEEDTANRALVEAVRSALIRSPMSLEDIAARFNCTKGQALDVVEDLGTHGLNLHQFGDKWSIEKAPSPQRVRGEIPVYTSRDDNTFVFGFLGDSHLGSKYCRLDVLESLYDHYERIGVDRVFHTGNWVDGEASFNRHDLLVHGIQGQLAYLAQNYPRRRGITTYAVAGDDHEGWWSQREGIDIGRHAQTVMEEHGREDWVDLGYMEAFIRLVNANTGASTMLHVIHPGGGSAYAISYTVQKIVEGYDGGEKPACLLAGHYHKLSYNLVRNVHAIQTGCFSASTSVETDQGRKKISEVVVGDQVLTHLGRYRKVTKLFQRKHSGETISLNFGRRGRPDQTVTATPEHPVLVEREGSRQWVEISQVLPGDVVFVRSVECPVTGEKMPYWMRLSRLANPVDLPGVREKIAAAKGGTKKRYRGQSCGEMHLHNDILPFCEKMTAEGWRMIPTGAGTIPDAIGFKDGKVVAFEVERSKGALLAHKQAKYEGAPITAAVDAVEWVDVNPRKAMSNAWYEVDETGFCKVKVLSVERNQLKRAIRVYNFEVEEDNSYVAGNVVVHNCTQDQTPFMRKKKLSAHVGGGVCRLTQDPETGAITACAVEFFNYFVTSFYNQRWSHADSVVLADRGA